MPKTTPLKGPLGIIPPRILNAVFPVLRLFHQLLSLVFYYLTPKGRGATLCCSRNKSLPLFLSCV